MKRSRPSTVVRALGLAAFLTATLVAGGAAHAADISSPFQGKAVVLGEASFARPIVAHQRQ